MSDLLNFLSGLGGGYVKGADLASKRKQAMAVATQNNAVRAATLARQQEEDDMSGFDNATKQYYDAIQKATEGYKSVSMPEDRDSITALNAPLVRSAFDRLQVAAKRPGVAKRGYAVPGEEILPAWVKDPNSPFTPGTTDIPDLTKWMAYTQQLNDVPELGPETVVGHYVAGMAPALTRVLDYKSIPVILGKLPLSPLHSSSPAIVNSVIDGLTQIVTSNRKNAGLAGPQQGQASSVLPPTPDLVAPVNNSPTGINPAASLTQPPPSGSTAGLLTRPSAPSQFVGPARQSQLRPGLPTGGTLPAQVPVPAPAPAPVPGTVTPVTEPAQATTAPGTATTQATAPTTNVPGAYNTSMQVANTLRTLAGLSNNYGNNMIPASLKPKVAPAKPAPFSAGPSIQNAVKSVDDSVGPVSNVVNSVSQITQDAFKIFNSEPDMPMKTLDDFTTNKFGVKVGYPTAMKLAEMYEKTRASVVAERNSRFDRVAKLHEMASSDALLGGKIQLQDFQVINARLDAIESSATLDAVVREKLAKAHTAMVEAMYAQAVVESDLATKATGRKVSIASYNLEREKFETKKLVDPLELLLKNYSDDAGKYQSGIRTIEDQLSTNNIGQSTASGRIQSMITGSDPDRDNKLRTWLGTLTKMDGLNLGNATVAAEEEAAWNALNAVRTLDPAEVPNLKQYRDLKIAALGYRMKKNDLSTKLNSVMSQKKVLEETVKGIQQIGGTLEQIALTNKANAEKAEKEKAGKKK